jgi:hypothetical protein
MKTGQVPGQQASRPEEHFRVAERAQKRGHQRVTTGAIRYNKIAHPVMSAQIKHFFLTIANGYGIIKLRKGSDALPLENASLPLRDERVLC